MTGLAMAQGEFERQERIDLGLEDHWTDPEPVRVRRCKVPRPGGVRGYCDRPLVNGGCPVHDVDTPDSDNPDYRVDWR